MKPKSFSKKLFLNKKTIAHLDNSDLKVVRGGICTINSLPQSGCVYTTTGKCCQ